MAAVQLYFRLLGAEGVPHSAVTQSSYDNIIANLLLSTAHSSINLYPGNKFAFQMSTADI